ncbi:hypothetical protein F511_10388 [Dorcoceras hygrometricum]|uniref:Uncharacterized protein n=1 Tax=Dorcoceras hygrometricum TaxID=472368 RepID=A0A2Z7CHZ0_9LAMI|nr:hypothetical protein F511_10388 [Dorcoceras hygrometricum]
MALQEVMRCRIVFSDLTLVSGICLAGVNRCAVRPNPISIDCRHFTPPFGARLVALSSSSLERSIDTSLETGVAGFEEHEVVAVFVYLRDC